MSGVRIIGLGSPHGDDRIGWEVIRLLELDSAVDGTVQLHTCATPGGALLALWQDAELVILVDALRSSAAPGSVWRFDLHPRNELCIRDNLPTLSSHGIALCELIELAAVLGSLPRRLVLIGVEIANSAPAQTDLSKPLIEALPEALRAVRAEYETVCAVPGDRG